MNKLKVFLICLLISILASLLLISATGCKTRKVSNSKAESRTEVRQEQSSSTSSETQERATDKSTEQVTVKDSSSSESETSVELEVDSIKRDAAGNTTIYPKPGSKLKVNSRGKTKQGSELNASIQNNLENSSTSKQDSTGDNRLNLDQRSEEDHKESDAEGSGSDWPWVIGGVLVIIGIFWVLLNRLARRRKIDSLEETL